MVRNNHRPDPRASTARMANGQLYDPAKFVVSPITSELIPVEEMAEHMRVSLIDPRCVCLCGGGRREGRTLGKVEGTQREKVGHGSTMILWVG